MNKTTKPKTLFTLGNRVHRVSHSRWSQIRTHLAPDTPRARSHAMLQTGAAPQSALPLLLHDDHILHRYSQLWEQGRGGQANYTPKHGGNLGLQQRMPIHRQHHSCDKQINYKHHCEKPLTWTHFVISQCCAWLCLNAVCFQTTTVCGRDVGNKRYS